MGLGKTAQAIIGADLVKAKRVLVICPAVARINWLREFGMWAKTQREYKIIQTKKDVASPEQSAICSYDLANLHSLPGHWDVVILDEAHFIKSVEAKRSARIVGKRPSIIHNATYRWFLTGTPMPKHPGDLWMYLRLFGKTKLDYVPFTVEFCDGYFDNPKRYVPTKMRPEKVGELRNLLSGVMLRRMKEQVMKDLPPIQYGTLHVDPGPVDLAASHAFIGYVEPRDRTAEFEAKIKAERETIERTFDEARLHFADNYKLLSSLGNSVATVRRYIGLQKIEPVVSILSAELEAGAYDKIVVFAVHRDVIELLRQGLRLFNPVTLYGQTDPNTRVKNIDLFQNHPRCRVFIGNIQAAGTAITLTSAHQVLFIEQDWVPGNNAQAVMRVHRIGQKKTVSVRVVSIPGTIDDRINKVLAERTADITNLFLSEGKTLKEDLPNRILPTPKLTEDLY